MSRACPQAFEDSSGPDPALRPVARTPDGPSRIPEPLPPRRPARGRRARGVHAASGLVRSPQLVPGVPRVTSGTSAAVASPSASSTAPCLARERAQHAARRSRQRSRRAHGRPRGRPARPDGEHDLDKRRQEAAAYALVRSLVSPNTRRMAAIRGAEVSPRPAATGPDPAAVPTQPARPPKGILGRGEPARAGGESPPVGRRRRRSSAGSSPRETLARPPAPLQRVGPRALQLQDLGPVNQAPARERHHVGLFLTPAREAAVHSRSAPHLIRLLTTADHAAVDQAVTIGDSSPAVTPTIASSRRPRPFGPLAPDQEDPRDCAAERRVRVAEAFADLGGAAAVAAAVLVVTGGVMLEHLREHQVAPLDAVGSSLSTSRCARPSHPVARPTPSREEGEVDAEPDRAAPRGAARRRRGKCVMGTLQCAHVLVVAAEHVRRRREQLQIAFRTEGLRIGEDNRSNASFHARWTYPPGGHVAVRRRRQGSSLLPPRLSSHVRLPVMLFEKHYPLSPAVAVAGRVSFAMRESRRHGFYPETVL